MAKNLFGLVHTLLDDSGALEPGGTIEVYDAGTTTQRTVYSDRALTTTAGYQITADAAGRLPERWLADSVIVKLLYKDSSGALLATRDYANDNASDSTDPVSATAYGFKVGGGNSDATANTTALQAALDANYWVQLPAGTAYINAITHTIVNRLSGAGTAANGTKLVLANSANSRAFIASSLTDMMYEDFAVDMNFANNVGSGAHDAFRLETCTKPVFRNIRVTGAQGLFSGSPVGGGFSLLNGSGARFYDCEATLCFDGLQSTGHTDCVVVGGYYNTNRRFGIVMGTASHRAKFYDVVANGNSTTDSSGGNWSLQDSDDCVAHTLTLNDAVLSFGGLVSGSDRFRGFDITANGNGLDGFGPYDSLDCRVDGFTSSSNAVRGLTIDTSSHMARFSNAYCFSNGDVDVSVFRSANAVVQDANFLTGRVHEATAAQSVAIQAAGSGYTNGSHVATIVGGTIGPLGAATFTATVSGGAVTAVSALINTGEHWTLPANPVSVTGIPGGSGATFNVTWLGANQQTATKLTLRGGGDAATMILATDPLTGGSATSAAVFEAFRGTLTDASGVAVQAAIGCTNFNVPVRNASLQNSWVVSTRAVYYKDSDGIVHVEGRIASGTVAADTLLFTLPTGFRPANSERFIIDANGSLGRIYVEPDGDVRDLGGTCSAAGTSLNSICFRAV